MNPTDRRVDVFFDFVSPYSYLGLALLPNFRLDPPIRWIMRPVVYGAILDATGLVGPAEVAVKRRYTFADIRRCAALAGLPLVGPPAHPFRSLEALRLVAAVEDPDAALHLAIRLADACWGRGLDLTDREVLGAETSRCGIDPQHLDCLDDPTVKRRLRQHTEDALATGVFGVPTFAFDGELFWGHDRIGHLLARIEGKLPDARRGLEELLDRPRGVDRSGAPGG